MLESLASLPPTASALPAAPQTEAAFEDFVGNTFFSQMLKALRSTQQEVAYLGGGQAEKTLQSQFDQMLVDRLADEHGGDFAQNIDVRI